MQLRRRPRSHADSYFKMRQVLMNSTHTLEQCHNVVKRENNKHLIDVYDGIGVHQTLCASNLLKKDASWDEQADRFLRLCETKMAVEVEPKPISHLKYVQNIDENTQTLPIAPPVEASTSPSGNTTPKKSEEIKIEIQKSDLEDIEDSQKEPVDADTHDFDNQRLDR